MSELSLGTLSGLAANSYVVDVAAGSSLGLSNATGLPVSALPAGSILQVVSTAKVDVFSTTSTSYTDLTGLTATITPASTSSKIMVFVQLSTSHSSTNGHLFNLVRGATNLLQSTAGGTDNATFTPATTSTTLNIAGVPIMFLDSPASASAQTYKLQIKTIGGTAYVNRRGAGTGFGSTSTITLMEVAG